MTAVTEREAPDATLTIRPLQPTIGAEISGVDLRNPLSDAERDRIKAAILQYKVVFFRDQSLDQDQHAAFARRFGPLYTHPSTKKANAEKAPAIHNIAALDEKKYAKHLARQQAKCIQKNVLALPRLDAAKKKKTKGARGRFALHISFQINLGYRVSQTSDATGNERFINRCGLF